METRGFRSLALRTFVAAAITAALMPLFVLGFVLSRFGGTATLPADCALVFGAAVHGKEMGDELAGPGIARRVSTAADLYHKKLIKKLFLSGGKGSGTYITEAQVMKSYAEQRGVEAGDMILEGDSTSTWENIHNTRPLMAGCRTVVGISDRYHLARIEFLAGKQGWGLKTYPAAMHATIGFEAWSVVRETLAILFYAFQPADAVIPRTPN